MGEQSFSKAALAAAAAMLLLSGCDRAATAEQGAEAGTQAAGAAVEAAGDLVERGRYLVTVMDCSGCHNQGAMSPNPQAGYLEGGTFGFDMPGAGIFWPPNLTPHPENGLGAWSEAEIVAALRTGARPDGRQLSPVMPWPNYAKLTDADAQAIAAYLKSLPPSARKVPDPATAETAKAPYLTAAFPAGTAPPSAAPGAAAGGAGPAAAAEGGS